MTIDQIDKMFAGFPVHRILSAGIALIQFIDLLECQTLGFINHKVHKGDAYKAAREPDEENFGLEISVSFAVVDEIGGGICNCPVEEPVGGDRHGESLSADFEREYLSADNPCERAPGGCKEENVDADESDGSFLSSKVFGEYGSIRILSSGDGTQDGNEKLTDTHPYGTP